MSSTKKTSSTQTTTPNAPSYLAPQTQTLATNTANLSGQDPYSFVAGADPLQTQAAQGAAGLGQNAGSYSAANGTLQNLATSGANTQDNVATVHGNSLLSNLQSYMSPYTNDVVNTTLANYDRTAGQNRAQQMLSIGGMDDTFGGSGAMSYLGNFDASNLLNRAQTEGGLRDQAFNVGTSLSADDANRRQQAQLANQAAYNNRYQFNAQQADTAQQRQAQAALGLVGVDQTGNADQRANLGAQTDIGSILQQIAQGKAGAPLSVQQAINSAYSSLVPSEALQTGQTTTGTSKSTTGGLGNVLGGLGSLAMGVGSLGLGGGGLFSQLGAGSLSGLRQFGIGNNLSPVNVISH